MKTKLLLSLLFTAALFTFSSCRDEPKPEVKEPVMKCTMRLNPDNKDATFEMEVRVGEGEMWIDLNGNGTMQPDEKLELHEEFDIDNGRDFTTSTATIHGKILMLDIESNSCVSIDATGNPHLQSLEIYDRQALESIDLSQNNQLVRCKIFAENLTTIKLSPQAIDLRILSLGCPHIDDKQLLEIAKTLPDHTGKNKGYLGLGGRKTSQEVIDLLKRKNWEWLPWQ